MGQQVKRMKKYTSFTIIFFLCAIVLRISLCWYNPPQNSFDDHFTPIKLILETGDIPAKDACWQCYQPPVFYYVSAIFVRAFLTMGINKIYLPKILQFINCFYAILTIYLIYLILNKLKIPDFSKILSFGIICFLPRHIYMSAMHSNDTMTCLFVSLFIYLLLVAIENKFSFLSLFALSISMTIAIFTKYTALVVIPVAIVGFAAVFLYRVVTPSKKTFAVLILALLLPTILFGVHLKDNIDNYGKPLPWNDNLLNTAVVQPNDREGINYFDFKPWEYVNNPIVSPGQMSSFWTLIHAGMWFDTEPKLIFFANPPSEWWIEYFSWLRGERKYPYIYNPPSNGIINNPLSSYSRFLGAELITLGLIPLSFFMIGLYKTIFRTLIFRKDKNSIDYTQICIFASLLISNIAGIIYLTIRAPVYSSIKALYFMNSLSAFSVFTSVGLGYIERNSHIKKIIALLLISLFLFSCLHIIQICYALKSFPFLYNNIKLI